MTGQNGDRLSAPTVLCSSVRDLATGCIYSIASSFIRKSTFDCCLHVELGLLTPLFANFNYKHFMHNFNRDVVRFVSMPPKILRPWNRLGGGSVVVDLLRIERQVISIIMEVNHATHSLYIDAGDD